jgi:nicotinate-nucleotide adenylyltransferase
MKLGLFGGTFDPIHLGHLIIAQEAQARLGLERVLFIPTGQPWMKSGRGISDAHHRLAMASRAVADNPAFQVSDMEVLRRGPTYTVDTLQELLRQAPEKPELFFILGVDSLAGLPRWKEPGRVLTMCSLVAVARPGHPSPDRGVLEALLPGAGARVQLLPDLHIGIGGTEVRQRVALGLPVRYWVPKAVEEYIMEHGLYRRGGVTSGSKGGGA